MAEYKKRSPKDQKRFLDSFIICGSVAGAIRACHIGATAHYSWLQHDETYPERFAEAKRRALDELEGEAHRRGAEGVKEYKFYKGQPILHPLTGEPYYEHRYSDVLLIRLLEANCPEKYGRVQHVGITKNLIPQVHAAQVESDDWYGTSCEAAEAAGASE